MSQYPWEFEQPACAEVGTNLFFAPDKDDPEQAGRENTYSYAKAVCHTCPHIQECADWGIRNEVHGVWGGLTPKELKQIRRTSRIPLNITPVTRYN